MGLVAFPVNIKLCAVPGSATGCCLWTLGTTKCSGPLVHCLEISNLKEAKTESKNGDRS